MKAVVDVEKRVIAIGGELHSDEEAFLLEQNSRQENLWGINLFTELDSSDMIEFDSMIKFDRRRTIAHAESRTKRCERRLSRS